mgnify:CR=1 FL=1
MPLPLPGSSLICSLLATRKFTLRPPSQSPRRLAFACLVSILPFFSISIFHRVRHACVFPLMRRYRHFSRKSNLYPLAGEPESGVIPRTVLAIS